MAPDPLPLHVGGYAPPRLGFRCPAASPRPCGFSGFFFPAIRFSSGVIYDALNQSETGLRNVGLAVGAWLALSHAFALAKPAITRDTLKALPFSLITGRVLIGIAGLWTLLLFRGFDPLGIPRMDMGEFFYLRPFITALVPVVAILVALYCTEFLSARALGCLILLGSAVALDAAFLKEPQSRLLLVFPVYIAIVKALFWIGMPYLLRDQIDWACASESRWRILAGGGLAYGVVLIIAALLWW